MDVVGPDFTSHRGVGGQLPSTFQTTHQFQVDRGGDSHLANIQFGLDVFGGQPKGNGTLVLHAPHVRRIEVQLNANLHLGYQQFAEVEDFDVRHEAQDTGFPSCMLGIFQLDELHVVLVIGTHGFEIIMVLIQLIGRQRVGRVDGIEPTLRFQDRLPVVSVVVQQGFKIRFVVIGVRLGTDEGPVESNVDLLEEAVSDVVDQVGVIRSHRVDGLSSGDFLQGPFQFDVTAGQVHEIFLRIDLEIHRVDASREQTDGHHAITGNAHVGRGDPKQVQHGVLDPRRTGDGDDLDVRHRLRRRLFFNVLLIQP